ncbi:MAG TPA: lipopolysaccharide kinase InaA family protein [Candidatus Binatia bacterium]|nr:lipopolysaccharide kinase InaA family protein [Candidatus Binatia bacterium]
MAADRRRAHRALRALVAPGVDLTRAVGPDGDPDRLLTHPRCRVVKFQRKVAVGEIESAIGSVYVKRYNRYAWRVVVGSLWRASPAFTAFANARGLEARGFVVPDAVAAVEYRHLGLCTRSFFITRTVADATTADLHWRALKDAGDVAARRAFVTGLGDLFRRLHGAGVYHGDLKDVNVLVRGPSTAPEFVLLDLERVQFRPRLDRRRRTKNLVQLERTLGRAASRGDRLRFLRAYLGDAAGRAARREWTSAVLGAADTKERQRSRPMRTPGASRVSCTVVCQDEAGQIAGCLESVAWCDEIVVIDGGSHDGTVEIARRYTPRVIHHPWPGYRAQKQFALEHATGEWVLNLDADERVTPELATEIQAALRHVPEAVDGFRIPRLVSYLGRWWYRGGWYPRPVVRLVRRAQTVWGGTDPHDRAVIPGKVIGLREPILHYTYDDIADHLRSVGKLTAVAATQVAAGRRVGLGRLLGEPVWRFFRAFVIKRGVQEGLPGFFVAATDAFYTFLRWARVWERERRP